MSVDLYQAHLDEMFSINNRFSETDVDRILERLLVCLPNNGRLYKYRSIAGSAFEHAYDSLANGYLWIPKAKELNDDQDAVLYYDPEKTIREIADYIFEHPYEFLQTVLNAPDRQFRIASPGDEKIISRACACLNRETGKINHGQALLEMVKDGIPRDKAIEQLARIEEFVESWPHKNPGAIESLAEKHLHYNDNLRDMAHIFSMTAQYDNDAMWAYYANNNEGFCVEYDFSKVKELPIDLRRQLISVYKVNYADAPEEFTFGPLLEWYLGGKNPKLLDQENKFILGCLLTKKALWKHEEEWRIFLTEIENKLCADIVSGIIVDERAAKTENGNHLIQLARLRGWCVKIRKRNITNTAHEYVQA